MIGKLPDFFKLPYSVAGKSSSSSVMLALSGGADSTCLLHLLSRARTIHGFKLYAAHVNHGIRGAEYGNEADRDEDFCKKLCRKLDVELFVKRVDVPALAESTGQSLETAARVARYAFFAEMMQNHSIEILATAHNADDNFETQLFNLCRGCGIDGICGIPESRPFPESGGIIVRPILSASKSEILKYCAENGIEFVTDSTNLEDDCVRNKLRLNVIPQLKDIFGSPERSAARLASYAKEASLLIDHEAKKLLSSAKDGLDCELLLASSPAVAKRAIRMAFGKCSAESLESVHVEDVLSFAAEKKNGRISLPGRVCARFVDGSLSFVSENEDGEAALPYSLPLSPGMNRIENTDFAVFICQNGAPSTPTGYGLYASAKVRASLPLYAKGRREGDRIFAHGMHKRIKKLMCDKKIPSRDRETLPLIFSGNELIWAPKCAISDSAVTASGDAITILIYKKLTQEI